MSNLFVKDNLKDIKNELKNNPHNEDFARLISLDYGCLRFLDSMKFFQESLEKVAESLTLENFKLAKNEFGDDEKNYD